MTSNSFTQAIDITINIFFYILLICSLLLVSGNLQAEIYTWKDAQGRTHFGDRPPVGSQATELELQINTYTSPEIKPLTDLAPLRDRRKVVMYSTEWCGVCKTAKRYFKQKKIAFKEYDVEKSRKGERDYKRLKGRGVPIILVRKQQMNGFSATRFESIYKQK